MDEETPQEFVIFGKRIERYLFALLLIAIFAFIIQAHFVSQIKFIGSSDPAFYAEVADNLIKGKGFVMDFINSYFVKFQSITHPEEYGFPGVSIILVPFILLFGKTAFAVKLPSMIAGVILLPILTYYLGKDFFNKRIGFLAAVSMIFYPTIFPISFGGERDTLYAFFLVAGIYFFYKGIKSENQSMAPKNLLGIVELLKENKYFLLMGAFLGYSYLIRQTTLLFIPVLIIVYYLLNKKFSKNFLAGLGVCALVMAPWLIRNYLAFGDPFFTVNKYVGWLVGYIPYSQQGIFEIWWDSPKPSVSVLVSIAGPKQVFMVYLSRLFTSLVAQFKSFLIPIILTFVGVAIASGKQITKNISRWMLFLIIFLIAGFFINTYGQVNIEFGLLYNGILASWPYIGILLLSLLFIKENKENTLFVLFWGGYAFFFSFIWINDLRYMLILVPFFLIYSWHALEWLLQKISEWTVKLQLNSAQIEKILIIFLMIFVLFSMPQTYGKFLSAHPDFPFGDDSTAKMKMQLAEKVRNLTEKDAVIMGCDIGVYHFYTDRKYVTFPSSNIEKVTDLIRNYNVSYFTLEGCERRGIDARLYSTLFGKNFTVPEMNPNATAARFTPPPGVAEKLYKIILKDEIINGVHNIAVGVVVY